MNSRLSMILTRVVVSGILLFGWLAGAVIHNNYIKQTGYGDITPSLMAFGLVLFIWDGVTIRTLFPAESRARFGALGGALTMVAIYLGELALTFINRDPKAGGGGETWFSFLMEAWFWIGIPIAISSALGALGWYAADRLADASKKWSYGLHLWR
jgi:hypothetical protein